MIKNIIRTPMVLLLLLAISAPLTGFAVSYAPLYHRQERDETVMTNGRIVHLFHSGMGDVKKAIHANDILTVYRTTPSCEVKEAGRIRVIAYIGETYLKGQVVEGEIRSDDIAKKGKVSCLVISAGICEP